MGNGEVAAGLLDLATSLVEDANLIGKMVSSMSLRNLRNDASGGTPSLRRQIEPLIIRVRLCDAIDR